MNFFLNRLNFSRRTRKSGWKIHRNNAKWLNSKPASLKNVTYIIGEFVCFTMQVSQLVWISFLKVKFLNSVKLPFLDRFEKFFLKPTKFFVLRFCKKISEGQNNLYKKMSGEAESAYNRQAWWLWLCRRTRPRLWRNPVSTSHLRHSNDQPHCPTDRQRNRLTRHRRESLCGQMNIRWELIRV